MNAEMGMYSVACQIEIVVEVKQLQSHLNTLGLSRLIRKDRCDAVSSEYIIMSGKIKF